MEANRVIKVKYGDTLRRFNARSDGNGQLDLNMVGLRTKIMGFFNFPLDEFALTYIDEDGDVVTLVDDEDLYDAMKQRLKFLRIDVHLNNDESAKSYTTSESSTPLRSPRVQPGNSAGVAVAELVKSVPEPFRQTFTKLSHEFASKAASSTPMVAELIDCFSKMGQSLLHPGSQSQAGGDSCIHSGPSDGPGTQSVPTASNPPNQGGLKEVLPKSRAADSPHGTDVGISPAIVEAPVTSDADAVELKLSSGAASSGVSASGYKDKNHSIDGRLKGKGVSFDVPTSSIDPTMKLHSTNDFVGSTPDEYPFNGLPNQQSPFLQKISVGPCKRSNNLPDGMPGIFHKGVQCDGCGVLPITGPRFKSMVKDNYDLCSICFAKMGHEADYIRMDRPMSFYRQPWIWSNYHRPRTGAPTYSRRGKAESAFKLDSRFILDVNVLDGTVMAPCTPFTKIWRMRNCGTVPWPYGSQLVWIGGDKFSSTESVALQISVDGVPLDGEIDIAVDFNAPVLPGRYISYWRMASPSGVKFGQRMWVLIQVDASLKEPISDGFQGLNLNLPAGSGGTEETEVIDPVVGSVSLDFLNSNAAPELAKPIVEGQTQPEQMPNIPGGDSLPVGYDAPATAPREETVSPSVAYPIIDEDLLNPTSSQAPSSSSFSYPIVIDLSKAAVETQIAPPVGGMSASSQGSYLLNDEVEQTLLKELEEMGFKQVDLNKQVLRMNQYDMEKSVDELCGVSEWDPILDELKEMGFCDAEMNRKLLKKNNGSIKGVVMDLLTGQDGAKLKKS